MSGGETSAYMTWWLLQHAHEYGYTDIHVTFANTGEEHENTLEFIRRCDEHFGFNTVWLEAVHHQVLGKGPTHRIVSYETASRRGEPFEAFIQKHGIPNQKFKKCTSNLKKAPMEHYAKTILRWKRGTYDTAIGIRVDEIDRMSSSAEKDRIVYPLISWHPRTKPQINSWWEGQPFRLELKGYEGNCKWCWKKSFRKHYTLVGEHPEFYDFPRRMERVHGRTGPEFRRGTFSDGTPVPWDYQRTFFRDNKSVHDLERERALRILSGTFVPADDESQIFDPDLDIGAGCEESCEVFSEEDEPIAV